MAAALDTLVDSLLYEGYALYPYTPGAVKNATPTPFGIVYPPAYAAANPATFDRLRMECRARRPRAVRATVRFLQAGEEGHQATERRVELPRPGAAGFEFGGLRGRAELAVEDGRVRVEVENRTDVPAGLERAQALRHSLLSTHVTAQLGGGEFVSPLESADCDNVNTWPVLAAPDDRAVLGAAIVLPDHPQVAPESRGSLFDGTEIEEALLLHVHALSDREREEIAAGDPAVREMVARAETATPQDILALHGRVEMRDPREGEAEAAAGGRTFRRGARVVLRPRRRRDVYDRMLAGRPARIERLYRGYDERLYIGVTVEGDPAHELLGESGRFLFFFPDEVEVVEP
jgi:hypothetical protein